MFREGKAPSEDEARASREAQERLRIVEQMANIGNSNINVGNESLMAGDTLLEGDLEAPSIPADPRKAANWEALPTMKKDEALQKYLKDKAKFDAWQAKPEQRAA